MSHRADAGGGGGPAGRRRSVGVSSSSGTGFEPSLTSITTGMCVSLRETTTRSRAGTPRSTPRSYPPSDHLHGGASTARSSRFDERRPPELLSSFNPACTCRRSSPGPPPVDQRSGGLLRVRRHALRGTKDNGTPLRGSPSVTRRLSPSTPTIGTGHRGTGEEVPTCCGASRQQHLEGVVAKRLRSTYQPGRRSGDWRKVKNFRTQEVVVGGWTAGPWPSLGNHRCSPPRTSRSVGSSLCGQSGNRIHRRRSRFLASDASSLGTRDRITVLPPPPVHRCSRGTVGNTVARGRGGVQ